MMREIHLILLPNGDVWRSQFSQKEEVMTQRPVDTDDACCVQGNNALRPVPDMADNLAEWIFQEYVKKARAFAVSVRAEGYAAGLERARQAAMDYDSGDLKHGYRIAEIIRALSMEPVPISHWGMQP